MKLRPSLKPPTGVPGSPQNLAANTETNTQSPISIVVLEMVNVLNFMEVQGQK